MNTLYYGGLDNQQWESPFSEVASEAGEITDRVGLNAESNGILCIRLCEKMNNLGGSRKSRK